MLHTKINEAIDFIKNNLFSNKTCLIYDHVIKGREQEFPTATEISNVFPNPCGYTTGMEDCMISGATMLDALIIRYEKEHDKDAADFAKKLVKGMLNCAFSAKTDGFLPRAVSIEDGKSHYPDSSRDQYTMFAFGMHQYLSSTLCTPDERKDISKAAVGIARRAERNVTQETGYDMLTDNGGPTLNNVMWGEKLGNHEYMRLPMLYLLSYEASGDKHWWEKYVEIRENAYEGSLHMTDYWALYTLQQMQASVRLCYDVEQNTEWRKRYLSLMNTVADYTEGIIDGVRAKMNSFNNYNDVQHCFRELKMIPDERFMRLGHPSAFKIIRCDSNAFFTLQDCAQVSIITGTTPNRVLSEKSKRLFNEAFSKIDLSKHERNLPLFFIDGYYRSI